MQCALNFPKCRSFGQLWGPYHHRFYIHNRYLGKEICKVASKGTAVAFRSCSALPVFIKCQNDFGHKRYSGPSECCRRTWNNVTKCNERCWERRVMTKSSRKWYLVSLTNGTYGFMLLVGEAQDPSQCLILFFFFLFVFLFFWEDEHEMSHFRLLNWRFSSGDNCPAWCRRLPSRIICFGDELWLKGKVKPIVEQLCRLCSSAERDNIWHAMLYS